MDISNLMTALTHTEIHQVSKYEAHSYNKQIKGETTQHCRPNPTKSTTANKKLNFQYPTPSTTISNQKKNHAYTKYMYTYYILILIVIQYNDN